MPQSLIDAIVGALISGSVVAFVGGVLVLRRTETIRNQIRSDFDQALLRSRSKLAWREASVSDLLSPLVFELDRSRRAFGRWTDPNSYIETEIVRAVNLRARDLLLSKAHLIPSDLWSDAEHLIEHYDRWLEEYEDIRVRRKVEGGFVFTGPDGYPFPSDAERRFRAYFEATWTQLYGPEQPQGLPILPIRSPGHPADRAHEEGKRL